MPGSSDDSDGPVMVASSEATSAEKEADNIPSERAAAQRKDPKALLAAASAAASPYLDKVANARLLSCSLHASRRFKRPL
jgi:hypothetical protein